MTAALEDMARIPMADAAALVGVGADVKHPASCAHRWCRRHGVPTFRVGRSYCCLKTDLAAALEADAEKWRHVFSLTGGQS